MPRKNASNNEPNTMIHFPGSEYSQEEVQFIKTVEGWRKKQNVRFPSFVQIYRLAKIFWETLENGRKATVDQ